MKEYTFPEWWRQPDIANLVYVAVDDDKMDKDWLCVVCRKPFDSTHELENIDDELQQEWDHFIENHPDHILMWTLSGEGK